MKHIRRTIKFRAWDKKYNQIVLWDDISRTNIIGSLINNNNRNISHGILMQFTGLLDKNGVEIYEGDILPLNIHYTKGNFVVNWDEKNALFRACLGGSGHCWKLETLNFKHIEVIGNIYQHPHLLHVKDEA